MIKPTTSTRIFSVLGNEKSLITLGFKDLGTIAGMTAGAYIAGKGVESKDRFMDEVGTSIIWLGGIPAFKWIIDKTVYKIAKANPDIDVKLLEKENKGILEVAKKHSSAAIKAGLETAEKNKTKFKNIFIAKFIASTALTLGAYFGLTMLRQKHTEKCVMKELKAEEKQKKLQKKQAENQKTKDPSFGFNMNQVANQIYQISHNPVQNTMIIDGGITTQRLATSRNIQDFMSYVIREGGTILAMYMLSGKIQSYLTKQAEKAKKPIDLDIKVLTNEKLQAAFADGSIKAHLDKFKTDGTDAEIYESLFKHENNLVVQMAKKTDIIPTENKENWLTRQLQKLGLIEKNNEKAAIDTQGFVDISAIKDTKDKKGNAVAGIKGKIENLYKAFEEAKKSGKSSDEFFNEIIKMKKSSIVKAVGASMGILGIVIPGFILASRLLKEDNKEFRVKTEMKEKMKNEKLMA
jgi:hypothetical protein